MYDRNMGAFIASGLLLSVALAGCGGGPAANHVRPTATRSPKVQSTPSRPAPATGTVVGGIAPCEGIALSTAPHFVAGTVTALSGAVKWRSLGEGALRAVYPTDAIARQTVAVNHLYMFRLPPGRYVLRARYLQPSNIRPFTTVRVRAGTKIKADIPSLCM